MKNRSLIKIAAIVLTCIIAAACLVSCGKSAGSAYDSEDMITNGSGSEIGDAGSSLPKPEYSGSDDALKDESQSGENAGEFKPKIIRTVTINAETRDFTSAISEIEASASELGGYIETCNIRNANNSYRGANVTERYADYVLRIPAEHLDAFLAETGALLNVTSTNSTADDISGEYYDIQARISVLETEKQLLEKMLSEADSVDTMLTLEKRLYDVIYEIESYKTSIKVYDSKVAYSTVNLYVREVAELTDTEEDKTFIERLGNAASETWKGTVVFAQEFVIACVYLIPVAIVGAVIIAVNAVIVIIIVKSAKRRARRARAAKE